MPTSYMASQGAKTTPAPSRNTRKGGLLEEILAAQEVTPHASPFPETPPSRALRDTPQQGSQLDHPHASSFPETPHSRALW
ncbi:hypothetical protein LSAT2_024374 [Lamellibrachia satsuma]|nr:hypothetical protein LSAT2_024374 [Lamellibrachia satsuma]